LIINELFWLPPRESYELNSKEIGSCCARGILIYILRISCSLSEFR